MKIATFVMPFELVLKGFLGLVGIVLLMIYLGFWLCFVENEGMKEIMGDPSPDPGPYPLPNGDEGDGYGPRPYDDRDQT